MTDMSSIPIDAIDPVPEDKPRRRKTNGKALAVASEAPPPVPVSEGDAFLAMIERAARDPQVDIDKMERLLDRRERMDAQERVRAFNSAMAAAKAEFEPIVKRHLVDFVNKDGKRTTYKHEDLADISAAVDPVLARHGLNTRYRATSNPNEPITCTCIVTHEGGHFEETTLSAGADTTGGKNSIQGIASTLSYLQRMTKKAALGLAAARDDDGRLAGAATAAERITEQQVAELNSLLQKTPEPAANVQIIFQHFKIDNLSELTPDQYRKTVSQLSKKLVAA